MTLSGPDERYARLKEIVGEASLLDGPERAVFVDDACGGDDTLRAEVLELLDGAAGASPLDRPPLVRTAVRDSVLEAADEALPPVPERLGRFRIVRRVALGGMGAVYEATQENPSRRVALKLLRQDLVAPGLLRRFRREAEILGRLAHPCIAQVHEAGTVEGEHGEQPFFSMEYVEGRPLCADANARALDVRARLKLFARICDAVEHAHQQGVIHRDLKPDNILVTPDGEPKVLDFGVARATDADVQGATLLTEAGQVMGTLPYMSPEQVAGDPARVGVRSDVYALGVVLFELLSGRRPHQLPRGSLPQAARIIQEEEATRLGSLDTRLGGDVETLVGKALEKDERRRYASAAELASDIRRYLSHQPIEAHPPSSLYKLRMFTRRNRGLVGGVVAAFVALLTGFGFVLHYAFREADSAAESRRAAYRASITGAHGMSDRDPQRAQGLLAEAPVDLRGFEWDLVSADLHAEIREIPGDPPPPWLRSPTPANRHNTTVALRPDGTPVGAVVRDGVVQLLELDAGVAVCTFDAGAPVGRPLLSPDASTLAASLESALVVWDVATGERLGRWPRTSRNQGGQAFSPDGSRFVWQPGEVGFEVLEPRTGRAQLLESQWPTDTGPLRFSPDGLRLLNQYKELDVERDLPLRLGKIGARDIRIECVAYDADGGRVALGDVPGVIYVGDGIPAGTAQLPGSPPFETLSGHRGGITAMLFSGDGQRLYSASRLHELITWDLSDGRPASRVTTADPVLDLVEGPDGDVLYAAGRDRLAVLTAGRHAHRRLRGHTRYVYQVAFSPDGRLLASAGWDWTVRLWDTLTGAPVALLELQPDAVVEHPVDHVVDQVSPRTPRSLSFSPDGRHLTVHSEAVEWTLDVATLRPVAEPREVAVAFMDRRVLEAPDPGAKAVTWPSGESHVVGPSGRRIWGARRESEGVVRTRALDEPPPGTRFGELSDVRALDVSPDGRLVAAGDVEGSLFLLDGRSGAVRAEGRVHQGEVFSLDFHPDGTRLASCGRDGNVHVWRVDPLEVVLTLQEHENYVHSVAFSPDGTQLAAGSGDGTVSLWTALSAAAWDGRRQAARSAREAVRPRVLEHLAASGDASAAAEAIRDDATLDDDARAAALRVLRELR